jgi:ribosomal protein L25 (general stress protein Ctc)
LAGALQCGAGASSCISATALAAPRRQLFGQTFDVGEIKAIRRDAVGSRNAQAARRDHLIPGIIYGYGEDGSDSVDLVYIQEADLRKEVNKRKDCFYNTLFDMCVTSAADWCLWSWRSL